MSETGRDRVEGTVGNDADQAAIGSNIQQDKTESKATGNVVYVYTTPPTKNTPVGGDDELMADVAAEIWKTIGDLNRVIGQLQETGVTQARATDRLALSIDTQAQRNEQNYQALQTQVQQLRRIEMALRGTKIQMPNGALVEPDNAHPVPVAVQQQHKWQPFLTPAILILILLAFVYFGATGGFFP